MEKPKSKIQTHGAITLSSMWKTPPEAPSEDWESEYFEAPSEDLEQEKNWSEYFEQT